MNNKYRLCFEQYINNKLYAIATYTMLERLDAHQMESHALAHPQLGRDEQVMPYLHWSLSSHKCLSVDGAS